MRGNGNWENRLLRIREGLEKKQTEWIAVNAEDWEDIEILI
jgi:hypothetical protein